MSFLNAWALGIAAAVVPALLLLYFLKLRRKEELVASTLLWKRAVQDLQVNAPFQKLRKNLLLLLQLLVLAAAIVALARPVVKTTVAHETSVVLLIDRSASMNALEGTRTRLELAKEQATRLVKTLNATGSSWFSFAGVRNPTRVMLIAFAERASVLAPFTTDTSQLLDLIRRIEPSDERTNLREALELAEVNMLPTMTGVENTPTSPEAPSRLILLSDGGVADLGDLVIKAGTMEFIKIGQTRDNAGITQLRVARNYERPERLTAFMQARNFAPEPRSVDVSLYVDGSLVAVKAVALPPAPEAQDPASASRPTAESSAATSLSFEITLDRAAVLEARLSRDDALLTDNRAFAVVPPPRKLRVLLVSSGNYFLESVLRGLPLSEVVSRTPAQYDGAASGELDADGRSRFDVVIFDKHSPTRLPSGNYLFVAGRPPLDEVQLGPLHENIAPIWWDESHPVLRYVPLDYVYIAKAPELRLPPQAQPLVEGPHGPLVARFARDGRHLLILSFAVEQSTWWSKPTFPVFAYNALRFLGNAAEGSLHETTRPGDALTFPLPAGSRSAKLQRPDGSTVEILADSAGLGYYGAANRVGVYQVKPGVEGRDRVAVNLLDESESDITPRGQLTVGSQQVAVGQAIRTSTPEIWRWFVGAALLIVLVEWYIYNRRVRI